MATLPATLATQSYSRDAERRADAYAAQVLHRAGLSPSVMALFFERILEAEGGEVEEGEADSLPISIASPPGHAERIRYFREWAPGP
jgi:predicted Zn-dependent protease